jgi:hypothetical protein
MALQIILGCSIAVCMLVAAALLSRRVCKLGRLIKHE